MSVATAVKILYLGDVVGRPARESIIRDLAGIKKANDIDIVVANVENVTSGAGITREHAELLHTAGIDMMTLGDHVWDRSGFENDIDKMQYVCRPANLPGTSAGKDFISITKNGIKIGVFVVLGKCFMKIHANCPFEAADRIIEGHRKDVDIMLCEVHAEATSEKVAFGWNYDNRVSCVVGSHTHIQTADERILPHGTAYITDLGMCGPHESIIGREIQPTIFRVKYGFKKNSDVAKNDVRLNGVTMCFDVSTGMATKIMRFSEKMS